MKEKPLVWLASAVKTPPFSADARIYAGFLLRRLQQGELLSLPDSRHMASIGRRCHELRITDVRTHKTWRIVYRIDPDAIVIGDVFAKKSQATPKKMIEAAKKRFATYDAF